MATLEDVETRIEGLGIQQQKATVSELMKELKSLGLSQAESDIKKLPIANALTNEQVRYALNHLKSLKYSIEFEVAQLRLKCKPLALSEDQEQCNRAPNIDEKRETWSAHINSTLDTARKAIEYHPEFMNSSDAYAPEDKILLKTLQSQIDILDGLHKRIMTDLQWDLVEMERYQLTMINGLDEWLTEKYIDDPWLFDNEEGEPMGLENLKL